MIIFKEGMPTSEARRKHDSGRWHTGGGIDIDMIAGDVASYGWNEPTLRVVERNGVFYSFDNRRLTAAKLAGIEVPVTRLDLNDPNVYKEFLRRNISNTNGLSLEIRRIGETRASGGPYDMVVDWMGKMFPKGEGP
jgi:hypothetical protein